MSAAEFSHHDREFWLHAAAQGYGNALVMGFFKPELRPAWGNAMFAKISPSFQKRRLVHSVLKGMAHVRQRNYDIAVDGFRGVISGKELDESLYMPSFLQELDQRFAAAERLFSDRTLGTT